MVYDWILPGMYSIPAQTAGEELDRIYHQYGKIEKAVVVEESRPENAPLHDCFEWRDDVAAEKYRENQASHIIRSIVAIGGEEKKASAVRAYVHVESDYHPMEVVVKSKPMYEDLLQSALRDLISYKNKYAALANTQELRRVFLAIDQISA